MSTRKTVLPLFVVLFAVPVWSNVFVRWTQPALPPAERLGVDEIAIPWNAVALSSLRSAAKQGYRAYAEVAMGEASSVARIAAKVGLAGIIVNPGDSQPDQIEQALRKLRSAYPRLLFLILNPNGKQPQMRGTLIAKRNGVLEATSPTAQPWLDTNLALVRLEQAFRPAQTPLYSFAWELTDTLQQQQHGPDAQDYALAVAEAGAFDADLVLSLHESLETGMAQNNPSAWAVWDQLKSYLRFFPRHPERRLDPEANVGVVTDDDAASYEPINLLARHNIALRVLRPADLSPRRLEGVDVVVVFSALDKLKAETVADFAKKGGVAVFVGSHVSLAPQSDSVQSAQPVRLSEQSVSYAVGKGRVIELSEPVTDPESFAQDIRRLIDHHKIRISLWNALTTVAVLYRPRTPGRIVELLNYAEEPLQVQVQVKGSFHSIRFESPEQGCCESLKPTVRDGFTEFVVPSLNLAGHVYLQPESAAPQTGRR
jgi:hypothetical protein